MACRRSRGGGLSTGLHNFADQRARLQFAPGWRLVERQPVIQAGRTHTEINGFSLSRRSLRQLARPLWSREMKNTAFGIEVTDEIRTFGRVHSVPLGRRWNPAGAANGAISAQRRRSSKKGRARLRLMKASNGGNAGSCRSRRCGGGGSTPKRRNERISHRFGAGWCTVTEPKVCEKGAGGEHILHFDPRHSWNQNSADCTSSFKFLHTRASWRDMIIFTSKRWTDAGNHQFFVVCFFLAKRFESG